MSSSPPQLVVDIVETLPPQTEDAPTPLALKRSSAVPSEDVPATADANARAVGPNPDPPKPAAGFRYPSPHECDCPSQGRNLVVCVDGTSNKFGLKNTNVVELYDRLIKHPGKQLTYYNSGIGTYAKPSLTAPSFVGRIRRVVGYQLDLAFAWRFENIILNAYLWLSENYQDGDRIFLFGFSRGAYQVRVLSAMIESVGLIHKGNQDQIPFAYELYAESGRIIEEAEGRQVPAVIVKTALGDLIRTGTALVKASAIRSAEGLPQSSTTHVHREVSDERPPGVEDGASVQSNTTGGPECSLKKPKSETLEDEAKKMIKRFKGAFSRTVRVHFVGVWDTVSSIGTVRDKSLPGTTRGMGHVCYFRHALALHERRVKFQPEFACGGLGPSPQYTSAYKADEATDTGVLKKPMKRTMAHTKEVWFAGSHAQIGGGDVKNLNLNKFGPALRWLGFEAELAGLQLKRDPERWKSSDFGVHQSLNNKWWLLEFIPFSRLRYGPDQAGKITTPSALEGISALLQRMQVLSKRTSVGQDRTTSWPNFGRPRSVQDGQLIHETAFDYSLTSTGRPATEWMATWTVSTSLRNGLKSARTGDGPDALDDMLHKLKEELRSGDHIEDDAYTEAQHVLKEIWDDPPKLPNDIGLSRLQKLSNTEPGRRSLFDALHHDPSVELVLAYVLNACISQASQADEISQDLAHMCACIFRALLVVKPGLEKTLAPGQIAQDQLKAMRISGKDSLANSCVLQRDLATMGPIRKLAAELAKSDPSLASDFMHCVGTSEFRKIFFAEGGTAQYLTLAPFPRSGSRKIVLALATRLYTIDFDSASDEPGVLVCDAGSTVLSLTVSQDGKRIASGCSDGTIRFWDSETGAALPLPIIPPINQHHGYVLCVAFSPKASLLASASADTTAVLWHSGTMQRKGDPLKHPDWVRQVAFSPKGDLLASTCDDGVVYLWDVETADLVGRFRGHDSWVMSVAFSPDGKHLASGTQDGTVRLWRTPPRVIGRNQAPFEPDPAHVLTGHTGDIGAVAFSYDSKQVSSCSDDTTVGVWDVGTGKLLSVLRGHTSAIGGIAYSKDRNGKRPRLVTCSYDGTVRRWDATEEWARWDSPNLPTSASSAGHVQPISPTPVVPPCNFPVESMFLLPPLPPSPSPQSGASPVSIQADDPSVSAAQVVDASILVSPVQI